MEVLLGPAFRDFSSHYSAYPLLRNFRTVLLVSFLPLPTRDPYRSIFVASLLRNRRQDFSILISAPGFVPLDARGIPLFAASA